MVLGTIKSANIIDIILVPTLNCLNLFSGIILFAICSLLGFTIIDIPYVTTNDITVRTTNIIKLFVTTNGICLIPLETPIYSKNIKSAVI